MKHQHPPVSKHTDYSLCTSETQSTNMENSDRWAS